MLPRKILQNRYSEIESEGMSGINIAVFIGKMRDWNFQPNKIRYQSKNYITLKLVRNTIQIFNQPHSTQSVPILYHTL